MRLFLIVWLGLLLSVGVRLGETSGCRVDSGGLVEGYPSWVLENDFVRASVVPGCGGRIANFFSKTMRCEYLLPTVITREEIVPGCPAGIVQTNWGGLEDWFWGTVPSRGAKRYDGVILERGGRSAAVRVSRDMRGFRLERTMRLRAESASLEITTSIRRISEPPARAQYWAHTYIQPFASDGTVRGEYLSSVPALKQPAGGDVKVDRDQVVHETPAPGNRFIVPAQGWWAMTHVPTRKTFVQLVPVAQVAGGGYLYTNVMEEGGINRITQEVIFRPITLSPEQEVVYVMKWCPAAGLSRVDYADDHMVLEIADCSGPVVRGRVAVVGGPDARFFSIGVNSNGDYAEGTPVAFDGLKPGVAADFACRLPVAGNTAGAGLRIRVFDAGNKVISENLVLIANGTGGKGEK